MTPGEIEDRAMFNLPLPQSLSKADTWLYIMLRALHSEHRLGQISREQARLEKQRLIKEYEKLEFDEKCVEHYSHMWARIERAAREYHDKPSLETADRFVEAVYGVKLKERKGERYE